MKTKIKCKCGKETINGRCKSCSNIDRTGKYKWKSSERIKGQNNSQWKNKPSYVALHKWVRRNKSKSLFCEICKINKSYDLANISGRYKRDINDFKWLCRKCHMKEDGRMLNLKQFQNG